MLAVAKLSETCVNDALAIGENYRADVMGKLTRYSHNNWVLVVRERLNTDVEGERGYEVVTHSTPIDRAYVPKKYFTEYIDTKGDVTFKEVYNLWKEHLRVPVYDDVLSAWLPPANAKQLGYAAVWRAIDDPSKVGFLPIERYLPGLMETYSSADQVTFGMMIKAGKFYRRYIEAVRGTAPETNEIEKFLKAYLPQTIEITEVSGEDIRYWYHRDNYNWDRNIGTLADSCMRSAECQEYFNIYTENPQVRMIIGTVDGKLVARSIVWTDEDGNEYVDRIYGHTLEVGQIEQYAAEKGYTPIYRRGSDITIQLDHVEFNTYPYMDTMKFLNISDKSLRSSASYLYDRCLEDTDGGMEEMESCAQCGETTYAEDMTRTHDGWVCRYCIENYYIYVENRNEYYHQDDVVLCDICDQHELTEESRNVEMYNEGHADICESCRYDLMYHDNLQVWYRVEEYYECIKCGDLVEDRYDCPCQLSDDETDDEDNITKGEITDEENKTKTLNPSETDNLPAEGEGPSSSDTSETNNREVPTAVEEIQTVAF